MTIAPKHEELYPNYFGGSPANGKILIPGAAGARTQNGSRAGTYPHIIPGWDGVRPSINGEALAVCRAGCLFWRELLVPARLRIPVWELPSTSDRTSQQYFAAARCDATADPSAKAREIRWENAPSLSESCEI